MTFLRWQALGPTAAGSTLGASGISAKQRNMHGGMLHGSRVAHAYTHCPGSVYTAELIRLLKSWQNPVSTSVGAAGSAGNTHHEGCEHKVELVEAPVGAASHVTQHVGSHANDLRGSNQT